MMSLIAASVAAIDDASRVFCFVRTAPLGMMSLIAASVAAIDDVSRVFYQLGLFVVTVLSGLFIQQLLLLPGVYLLSVRRNPFTVLMKSTKAWCMAFASSSS